MTLEAHLKRLHLTSPQPAAMASFYSKTFGYSVTQNGDSYHCEAQQRQLWISPGPANHLKYSLFELKSDLAWLRFREATRKLDSTPPGTVGDLPGEALVFRAPDGNLVAFIPPQPATAAVHTADLPAAILQHYALRTDNIHVLLAFYRDQLGFVLSDRVHDHDGSLKACFLRTDHLHHALALFAAPMNCFDHHSYETDDWNDLKVWADRMGRLRTEIVWGVGRHGPGNDVFFMVRDPDGNLAEISAEIEVCAPDRPVGVWPHEERTLNQWGRSIMRS